MAEELVEEIAPKPSNPTEAETLLFDWLNWWWSADDAPAKLPKSLHIKTSLYFTMKQHNEDLEKGKK